MTNLAMVPSDREAPNAASGLVKLAIRDLEFFYGKNRALHGVNFDIPSKGITAIIGPSGCGKSTLLRTINRVFELYPEQTARGKIFLDGENILDDAYGLGKLRSRVGMVFQKPTPFNRTIYDNVAIALTHYEKLTRPETEVRVEQALRQAALWDEVKDTLKRSALSLSGGQQQRLCIARALAVQPSVLLLDEPTSALDPMSTAKIEELLFEQSNTFTFVIVTHNLQQAARIAGQTAFMLNGYLVEVGDNDRIFVRPQDKRTEAYVTGRFG